MLWRYLSRLGSFLICLIIDHKPGRFRFKTTKMERLAGQVPVIEYENILECARCGAVISRERGKPK